MKLLTKFIIAVVIIFSLCTGCASDHLTMERDGVKVTVDIEYLLQKKSFKSLEYDFQTGKVKITNFGSDTSETLQTFGEVLIGYTTGATITP